MQDELWLAAHVDVFTVNPQPLPGPLHGAPRDQGVSATICRSPLSHPHGRVPLGRREIWEKVSKAGDSSEGRGGLRDHEMGTGPLHGLPGASNHRSRSWRLEAGGPQGHAPSGGCSTGSLLVSSGLHAAGHPHVPWWSLRVTPASSSAVIWPSAYKFPSFCKDTGHGI